jgi:hypothetical protein
MYAPNDQFEQTGCDWGTGFYADAAQENRVARGNHGTDWRFVNGFTDGHSAYVEMRGHSRAPRPPGMPDACPDDACDCFLVRTPNWQRDTLPLTPRSSPKAISYPPASSDQLVP